MDKRYQVEFEEKAQEALKQMESHQAYLMMGWIKKNLVACKNPRHCGTELAENEPGEWLYKIGNYRLIAHISEDVITILAIQLGYRII